MPFANVGDLSMHYLEQGAGDSVLLIHGNTSSSVWWEYTLERLGDAYHFIAPDLRGRGATQGPSANWTVEMLARDVYGLLARLDIEAAHVVGHSLGADVALQLALDHPAQVRSLLLLNPGWVAGDMPEAVGDEARVRAMVENKDLLKAALRGIAYLHPADGRWARLEAASLLQADEASLRGPAALKAWAVADRLHELAGIPTLVARGAQDQYLSTREVCQRIVDHLPGAAYAEIPDASHSPNVEAPDAWVALLREHLARAGG